MKMFCIAAAALALCAGPAAAQSYGTFSPGKSRPTQPKGPSLADAYKPSPLPSPYAPPPPAPALAKPKTYGVPETPAAPTFKPYEPWKPTPPASVFGPDSKRKR